MMWDIRALVRVRFVNYYFIIGVLLVLRLVLNYFGLLVAYLLFKQKKINHSYGSDGKVMTRSSRVGG